MIKKVLLCVFLCCALIIGMAFPAFAADGYTSVDGYVYVGSLNIPVSDFVFDGANYTAVFTPSSFLKEPSDACLVSFGDKTALLGWWAFDNGAIERLYCIGDRSLHDPAEPGNGEGFLFALNRLDKTKSFFVCTSTFYDAYVSDSGNNGFTISFSVPQEELTPSITDGLSGAIDSAGSVVSALLTPGGDLFGLLPVIGMGIGLSVVVWGIRKFKDCTWGF